MKICYIFLFLLLYNPFISTSAAKLSMCEISLMCAITLNDILLNDANEIPYTNHLKETWVFNKSYIQLMQDGYYKLLSKNLSNFMCENILISNSETILNNIKTKRKKIISACIKTFLKPKNKQLFEQQSGVKL